MGFDGRGANDQAGSTQARLDTRAWDPLIGVSPKRPRGIDLCLHRGDAAREPRCSTGNSVEIQLGARP